MKSKLSILLCILLLLFTRSVLAGLTDEEFSALRAKLNEANRVSPEAGIAKADELLTQYQAVLSAGQKVRVLYVKSWAQINADDIEAAFKTLAEARLLAYDVPEPAILYSYYSISASAFANVELYKLALENHQKAYQLAPLLNQPGFVEQTENNIGHIYLKLDLLDEAEFYFQRFYDGSIERDQIQISATALNNLGEVAYKKGNYELALQRHQNAMQIRKEYQLTFHQGWSYYNLGRVYAATNDIEQAKYHLNKAIEIWSNSNADARGMDAKLALANVLYQQNEFAQALALLADIFATSETLGLLFPVRDGLDLQRQIHTAQNNLPSALADTERYIKINERILQRQESIGLSYTVLRTELQTKELALEQLKQEKEMVVATAKAKQQFRTLLLLSALVVLAVSVIFTVRLNRKKKALVETVRQLNSTRSKLVESEKMRAMTTLVSGMAHQLNTPLGLILTANSTLQSQLRTLKDNFAQKKLTQTSLEQFLDESDQLLQVTQNNSEKAANMMTRFKMVSAKLEKSELSTVSLLHFLEEQMPALELIKTRSIALHIEGEDVSIQTYAPVLLKVMSQLVENSYKHGFTATSNPEVRVEVAALPDKDSVRINYYDNGAGIPEEKRDKVFDPFYTTRLGEGNLGLGLNIIYNSVVHLMKGQVRCGDSENGAHFEIVIPMTIEEPAAEVEAEAPTVVPAI